MWRKDTESISMIIYWAINNVTLLVLNRDIAQHIFFIVGNRKLECQKEILCQTVILSAFSLYVRSVFEAWLSLMCWGGQ
jgi:hypothetical protein